MGSFARTAPDEPRIPARYPYGCPEWDPSRKSAGGPTDPASTAPPQPKQLKNAPTCRRRRPPQRLATPATGTCALLPPAWEAKKSAPVVSLCPGQRLAVRSGGCIGITGALDQRPTQHAEVRRRR